jgi:hypothetical protein
MKPVARRDGGAPSTPLMRHGVRAEEVAADAIAPAPGFSI